MFKVGDRVRLVQPFGLDQREAMGTVASFLTPGFAAVTGAPDDVLVRWDSGLELSHAPHSLARVLGDNLTGHACGLRPGERGDGAV